MKRPAISIILDMVREGRISPGFAAEIIELRRRIAWRRQPLWVRIIRRLFGDVP